MDARERATEWIDRVLRMLFPAVLALIFLRPSFLKFSTPLGTVSLTSAKNIVFLFSTLWLAAAIINPRRFLVPVGLHAPLIALLGVNALCAALSPFGDPSERWRAVLSLSLCIAFFSASLHMLRGSAGSRMVLILLFLLAVVVATVDLAYHYSKDLWLIIDQGYPVWDGKNALGLFMVITLSVCTALTVPAAGRSRGRWQAPALYSGLFLIFLCAIYSYSRAAWLSLALAAVVFAALRSWRLVVLLVAAALALSLLPHRRIMRRFFSTGGGRDRNVVLRIEVWRTAWRMLRARPLLGVGPGEFRSAYPEYSRPHEPTGKMQVQAARKPRYRDHAHNLFLQVAAEAGVAGLAILLWGCALVGRELLRRLRSVRAPDRAALLRGIAAALASFLTFSLVDSSWTGRFTGGSFMHINLTVAVLLAMLYSTEEQGTAEGEPLS